ASSVHLGDVAEVVYAPEPPIGGATIMGQPGVMLNISGQYGANTVEATQRVEEALADLRPGLEKAGIKFHADL
ncbi:efflux RND transporter permease subunit, partial [Klebsiella pneumoniae]|nr:efflux RND transporter permease subunit [Klebsiella pneumoniae]